MTDNLSTRIFNQGHLDIFQVHPDYKETCFQSAGLYEELGKIGQCASHVIDGRILYVGGWMMLAPGVAEVFIHPSIYVPRYAKSFVKHVKWWLAFLLSESHIRRLQTAGSNTLESDRWLQCIGFTKEGVLSSFLESGKAISIWGMVK